MAEYTLMNKNKKIFDFTYDEEKHIITEFKDNYPDTKKYAPFGLIINDEIDEDEFSKWWKNRQIPASRIGLKEFFYSSGIYDEDNFDLLDSKAFCLSLSDQYWVKPKGKEIRWEDINFFDNEFSEDIGKILFNGNKLLLKINLNTPDLTCNGNYEKRWKIVNKDRYLLKAGSKPYNQEPYNELIATKLYERLLDENEYVKYSLIDEESRTISMCKNFITKETELIPAWKINDYYKKDESDNKYEHYIKCLEKLGIKNAREKVDKMIICDYILANKDRHFNNFGVIRNVETLEYLDVAPLFDNGCSLWYDENDIFVGDFFLTKPFEEYEAFQIKLVKNFQWIDFSRLSGFTDEVKDILSQNKLLSEERINKIVEEVEKRINTLKNISNQ